MAAVPVTSILTNLRQRLSFCNVGTLSDQKYIDNNVKINVWFKGLFYCEIFNLIYYSYLLSFLFHFIKHILSLSSNERLSELFLRHIEFINYNLVHYTVHLTTCSKQYWIINNRFLKLLYYFLLLSLIINY